jgi:F0F1-type ATP synthase assembly protein I
MTTPPEKDSHENGRRGSEGSLSQLARYSDLALVMPGGAIAGWFIGAGLDHLFSTHWIYLAGAGVGIIGGFVRIVRVAVSSSRE